LKRQLPRGFDHRPDRLQIVYGLLSTREGLPVAVEVFDGNTGDPTTLTSQVAKLKQRFALDRVLLVGDRGMLTSARIREDVRPAGFDWISCLRSGAIQELATEHGPLQLSLFDERDLAEIAAPEQFPGERLIVCRNPLLAAERARKREDLLAATERDLARVRLAVERRREPLRGQADPEGSVSKIGLKVGAILDQHKMAKHFEIEIGAAQLTWRRKPDSIEREARLDGIYVVRTSLPAEVMSASEAVQAYKDLARVERAFRCLKTIDLDIRPVRH
jgi:transposase